MSRLFKRIGLAFFAASVFIISVFTFNTSQGQDIKHPVYDSLLLVLSEQSLAKDTSYVHTLLDVANMVDQNYPDTALVFIQEGLDLIEKEKYDIPRTKCALLNSKGLALWHLTKYDTALKTLSKSLEIAMDKGFKDREAVIYTNIGNIYIYTDAGSAEEGEKYYLKAKAIYEELGMKRNLIRLKHSLGNCYYLKEEYDKALENFRAVLEDAIEKDDKSGMALGHYSMGLIYSTMGDFKNALKSYSLSAEADKVIGVRDGSAPLGVVSSLIALGRLDEALVKAEKYYRDLLEYGSLQKAQQALDRIIKIHRQKGDFEKAYNNLDALKKMKDSIYNAETLKARNELRTNFEIKQKDAENRILKQEKKIAESEKELNRLFSISAGGGLVLVLFILVFVFRNNRRKQRTNKLLEKQNHEITEKREELLLRNEEINQQSEEIKAQRDALEAQSHLLISKNRAITQSIQYAERIQSAILPLPETLEEAFKEHFVLFKPRDIVSGDFYRFDSIESDSGQEFIVVAADCTGHGVPGAFMSMIGDSLFTKAIRDTEISSPAAILDFLQDGIKEVLKQDRTRNRDGMDAAVLSYKPSEKRLRFAGAKNPLILIRGNEMQVIKGDKFSVGGRWDESISHFTEHEIILDERPAYCYIFSDGYHDQFGGKNGRKFMSKNLRALLFEIHQMPMTDQRRLLGQTLNNWMKDGNERQIDDVLVIGLRLV